MRIEMAVYGTLKKGWGNNSLLGNSKLLRVVTIPGYQLWGYGCPFAIKTKEKDKHIKCEIYLVDCPRVLEQIDNLEGHPDWYRRIKVTDSTGAEVQMYEMPSDSRYGSSSDSGPYSEWDGAHARLLHELNQKMQ